MDHIRIDESQTVAEFIETLKQFPQELPIRINHIPGTEIMVYDEFYDGDSANPKCPVIRAVVVV